ncbi:hypothetical protein LXA47_30570 [Massilia sp. P8910]|uniref:hypothetical protein n=1 Tax=Massilia antarctica TaxID=2765360 RepID=UPI001E42957D|nr:hypothetical protein [Massilia antarctica]MCE3607915.1 hypothetical protein [Massilia antarctica]
MSHLGRAPQRSFITHGESAATEALRRRVAEELGWPREVPGYLDEVTLARGTHRQLVSRSLI